MGIKADESQEKTTGVFQRFQNFHKGINNQICR